ncbi:hypothetical protein STCU_01568 [Strigomonas culicis]|uniref:Mechanosensitive ion channel MscS domain-containing protein n=1 Tax=Strigomonas culicis TaxID=28005 RepID=S9WFF9_9TRYP|nr:hypothetical protein STCU_01985 [Strigomonas culicis]EPY34470.1 hypothetical protein STCU_01568 [Strigomonas culicis]|eukprot:EPY33781.1 hypothetical protein STCU_01985 [Strigomonas culicis]
MKRFFNSFYERTGIIADPAQRSVASRVSALLIEGTVVFSLLGTVGVDTSPLIAAAGVTGATIGFACKDFGANFVASIALAGQSSLRVGNDLTVGTGPNTVSGKVVNWDTRYLYLRNKDGQMVCVPNNIILTSVVCWNNAPASAYGGAGTTTATTMDKSEMDKKWQAMADKASKEHAIPREPAKDAKKP